MAFVIKPLVRQTFDAHWTPDVARQLNQFIRPQVGKAHGPCHQATWAIDESAKACLVPICLAGHRSAAWCYAFVMNGEFTVIRQEACGLYSFVCVSPGLVKRIEEVKRLVAEALRVGGEFLDGTTGVNDLFAVPDAKFLSLC
jgi:hypothetical protein